MTTIRWGILATGTIAGAMAEALHAVPAAEIAAVASRTQQRADEFGDEWGIARRYGRYADLAADPDVDVIYVATPHNLHHDNMTLCLNAGKHVLCEKPLTLNAAQAAACIALARDKGLFLMEAVWMRFFPAMARVREWVAAGTIGDVRLITADFCVHIPYDPAHRLYNLTLGGGALLDLGLYPLSLATMLLGFPQQVGGHAHLAPTGVDEVDAITLRYDNGAIANLGCAMRVDKPRHAYVAGSEGTIHIHDPFFRPQQLTLHRHGAAPQTHTVPYPGNGYVTEVEEVHACLRAGRTESAIMPLDDTLRLMQLMDTLRARWGVRYPDEDAD